MENSYKTKVAKKLPSATPTIKGDPAAGTYTAPPSL